LTRTSAGAIIGGVGGVVRSFGVVPKGAGSA
jgi:hypothetical protein